MTKAKDVGNQTSKRRSKEEQNGVCANNERNTAQTRGKTTQITTTRASAGEEECVDTDTKTSKAIQSSTQAKTRRAQQVSIYDQQNDNMAKTDQNQRKSPQTPPRGTQGKATELIERKKPIAAT